MILDSIRSASISSLAELHSTLEQQGIIVNQSTLSRDIAELKIGKRQGFYAAPENFEFKKNLLPPKEKLFRQFVVSAEQVGLFAVIRTLPASANPVAIQLDKMTDFFDFAGSVAGDDTIFVLNRTEESARRMVGWFDSITGSTSV